MAIGFIPPTLGVLEDQRVTVSELNWYTQTCILIIITTVMMTAFWELIEKGME